MNFFDIYFRISKNVDEQRVSIRFDKRCLKLIVILEDCPLSIIFAVREERVEDKFAKCSTDITRFSWNHVKKKKSLKSAIINARWQEKEKRRLKRYRLKIYSGTERIRSRLCGHKSTCSYDNPKGVEFACVRGGLITEDRRRIYRWEHRSLRRIRHVNPIEPSATTGLRANRSRLIEEGGSEKFDSFKSLSNH